MASRPRAMPTRSPPHGAARASGAIESGWRFRSPAAGASRSWVRPVLLGGAPAVATWVGQALLASHHGVAAAYQAAALDQGLAFGTVVLALFGASACLLMWQIAGEPAEWLPVSAGLFVFGVIEAPRLLAVGLRPALLDVGGNLQALDIGASIALIAGLCLLVWPAARVLSSRMVTGGWRTWLAPATLLLAGALVLTGFQSASRAPAVGQVVSGAAVAIASTLVAGVYAVTWWRERRPLHLYLSVSLLVLAQSGAAVVLGVARLSSATAMPSAFRFEAALCAVVGAVVTLRARIVTQGSALRESEVRRLALEHSRRTEHARSAEARHEVRSALLAMRSGLHLLEPRVQELESDDAREALQFVRWGLESLASLAAADRPLGSALSLAEVLTREAAVARRQGLPVRLDFRDRLQAPAAEPAMLARAVRALLDNARVHAPGSPVLVTAGVEAGVATVTIEDRGPGIPAAHREAAFARGWRGDAAAVGEGLGLHIARRLVREQGGDVGVEDRAGGGARFVLRLRSAQPDPPADRDRRQASASTPRRATGPLEGRA